MPIDRISDERLDTWLDFGKGSDGEVTRMARELKQRRDAEKCPKCGGEGRVKVGEPGTCGEWVAYATAQCFQCNGTGGYSVQDELLDALRECVIAMKANRNHIPMAIEALKEQKQNA